MLFIKKVTEVSGYLARLLMVSTSFVTFCMAFAILIEIICRAVGISYFGTAEHVRNLIILIVFLQLPYAVSSGSMLSVDLLSNACSQTVQLMFAITASILGMVFFSGLALGAYDPALDAWLNNHYEGEGIVDVPAWPAKFAIVLGSLFSAWLYALRLLSLIGANEQTGSSCPKVS